ncbi:MAG: ATP phosphoribosyltransferase [Victivallaceae bacterium]|nr:ATP phosphoribosyltransferase [Victivallaceae bacterium]
MENRLKIAVPNKGALSEGTVELLTAAGYKCKRSGRELMVGDCANGIDFVFLRPRDIALYVGKGVVDLGITGRDLALDSGVGVAELLPLGIGKSRFCFAAPKGKYTDVRQFDHLRIACSYPVLLQSKLDGKKLDCTIVRLEGAVEISIKLGVADVIADVVESGTTLREAGLEIVGEPLLESEALLIGRDARIAETECVRRLIGRIRGILLARNYLMIEYDIQRRDLEACCRITPGIEAPTVSPLANPDWVAVKAMVLRSDCNRIMDELYAHGARGIITTDIRSCRL